MKLTSFELYEGTIGFLEHLKSEIMRNGVDPDAAKLILCCEDGELVLQVDGPTLTYCFDPKTLRLDPY